MDQNEPAVDTPYFLNPLGRISNRSSGSLQRVPQYSVPDIQPEPRPDFLRCLGLDGFFRCIRRPFHVIQSLTYSKLRYASNGASGVAKFFGSDPEEAQTRQKHSETTKITLGNSSNLTNARSNPLITVFNSLINVINIL